jgi:hypothetical protein
MRLTFPQVRRVGFSTINDESIIGPFESSSQVFNSAASKWGLLRRFNSLPLSESIGSFNQTSFEFRRAKQNIRHG